MRRGEDFNFLEIPEDSDAFAHASAQDSSALSTKFLRSATQMMPPNTMMDVGEQVLVETSIVAEMLASAAEAHPDGIAYTDIAVDINDAVHNAATSKDAD